MNRVRARFVEKDWRRHDMQLHNLLFLRGGIRLLAALMILAAAHGSFAATYTTPRALNIGDTYELTRDGWSDPPGGGAYTGDVIPKIDTNTGTNGDNRFFVRHNVARAWATGIGYWFTGSDQFDGEPDPAGEQWVEYAPPIEILRSGRYSIDAAYRWSTGRASYPAVYRVHHALGTNEVLRDQRIGSAAAPIFWFTVGEFEMRPGSFVRVVDTGAESITFSNMRFRLIAPVPVIKVEHMSGEVVLRWPTNAIGYRLETTTEIALNPTWEETWEAPVIDGSDYKVSFPSEGPSRFFRLIER